MTNQIPENYKWNEEKLAKLGLPVGLTAEGFLPYDVEKESKYKPLTQEELARLKLRLEIRREPIRELSSEARSKLVKLSQGKRNLLERL